MEISDLDAEKLLNKPSYFVNKFIGEEPFPYQKEFLDCGENRRIFVAGRRVGKSLSSAWLALWYALTHRNADVLITARAQRQSMNLFRTVKDQISQSELDDAAWDSSITRQTRTIIEFSNGSSIKCLPVGRDGSTIRGEGADLLIVDEAAYIKDQIFQEVLVHFTAVGDNTFVMTSTPAGEQGYMYQRYIDSKQPCPSCGEMMTKRGDWVACFDCEKKMKAPGDWHITKVPTWKNEEIPESWVEEQRRDLTPMQFEQEIKGNFVTAEDSYFTPQEVQNDRVAVDQAVTQADGADIYLGADLAHTGDDETVLISLDSEGNVWEVSAYDITLSQSIQKIKTLDRARKYDKIIVDETGLGAHPVEELKESLGRKVQGYAFSSNKKKQELYSNLKKAFQNEEIRYKFVPTEDTDNERLVQQLLSLEFSRTSTQKTKIEAASGEHDDFADALALAVWAKEKKGVAASDPDTMKPFTLADARRK
jgi:hypothetical protein